MHTSQSTIDAPNPSVDNISNGVNAAAETNSDPSAAT